MNEVVMTACKKCGSACDPCSDLCEACKQKEQSDINSKSGDTARTVFIIIIIALIAALVGLLVYISMDKAPATVEKATYRKNMGDGMISIQELSYVDDTLCSIKDVVQIKTLDLTQEDIDAYIELFDGMAEEASGVECMEYIKEITDSKLTLGFVYSNLDNRENIRELALFGYISNKSGSPLISLSQTEDKLVSQGYKKIANEE